MVERQRRFDADLRQLAAMRAFLSEVCQEEPVDEDMMLRLKLALTEAASNIVLHGGLEQSRQSVALTIAVDDQQVSLTLQYAGKPFDPETAAAPVFDGSQENGFGLYLIRQSVDEIEHRQDDEGRCRTRLLVKRRQHHKGEDHATCG